MIRVRETLADNGEELSKTELAIPVLYDNYGYVNTSGSGATGLQYKAIIDGYADLLPTDKVKLDNKEYNIKSLNLVQYNGLKYIWKLEAELAL
jgi:hypothetical protein